MISVMPAARRFRHTVMPSTERLPRGGNIVPSSTRDVVIKLMPHAP